MVELLGDFLTPVFLFDQESVLGCQHNGTNPIHRSTGHLPDARLVNRKDAYHHENPSLSTPSTFQVIQF